MIAWQLFMHISDGVLPTWIIIAGNGVTALATGLVLARFREEDIPRTAVMASLFFAVSWIAIPTPLGSAHLLLGGLMGIVLGWHAVPAILIALAFQLLLFRFGGVYTLGVNTFNLAAGALAARGVFQARRLVPPTFKREAAGGLAAGAAGVAVSGLGYFGTLLTAGENLRTAAQAAFLWHLPVLAIEAAVTAFAVGFLARVKPGLLGKGSVR